jgi:GT2 family glycosyltransferase
MKKRYANFSQATLLTILRGHCHVELQRQKISRAFPSFFQIQPLSKHRLYVVDNASTDGSAKWLKSEYPSVDCITLDTNKGYAGGYNEALANIEAKYFAIVNSDVEITSQWLDPSSN